ncbi:hypothetical protein [Blastococcus litoris]|uniref:hypothetical protein n=1 Tax=Blastococcus litoris TaxID=2171622 RepID=UPI000E300966|nr:hypothetical protein [Blastococcus litoris]
MIDAPAPQSASRPPARAALLVALVPLAAVTWWLAGSLSGLLLMASDSLADLARSPSGSPVPRPDVVALPLISVLGLQVANSLLGGILAGLLGRVARGHRPALVAGATLGGVVLGLAVVLLYTAVVPGAGGVWPPGSREGVAIGVSVVVSSLLGWLLGSCVVLGRLGSGAALGALAGALPSWLVGLSLAVTDPASLLDGFSTTWTTWAGALVLVAALVVVGARPLSRVAWWPPVVVLSWLVFPVPLAVHYLLVEALVGPLGTPPLWRVPGDAVVAALRDPLPWVAAVVVAAAVSVGLARWRGVRRPAGGAGPRSA